MKFLAVTTSIFPSIAAVLLLTSAVKAVENVTVDPCATITSFTLVNPRTGLDIGPVPRVVNLGYYPAQATFNIRIDVSDDLCQRPLQSMRVTYYNNGTRVRSYCDKAVPYSVFGDSLPVGAPLSKVRYFKYQFPNVTSSLAINASILAIPYFEVDCNGTYSRGVPKKKPFKIVNSTVSGAKALDTTPELRDAVDRWLAGENTSDSDLAALYGYPIGKWDVSKISDFSYLFDGACGTCNHGRNTAAKRFNDDISEWNVSSARLMHTMFRRAASFNGNLSAWDVSNVYHMGNMFNFATAFNGDISQWDVSNVQFMNEMFYGATSFNSDISSWNVSSVKNTIEMFREASSFNIDISPWKVSRITHMSLMFLYASSFNQSLCAWGSRLFRNADMDGVFLKTACPNTSDPNLAATPPGPLCYTCN